MRKKPQLTPRDFKIMLRSQMFVRTIISYESPCFSIDFPNFHCLKNPSYTAFVPVRNGICDRGYNSSCYVPNRSLQKSFVVKEVSWTWVVGYLEEIHFTINTYMTYRRTLHELIFEEMAIILVMDM